jgi:hypothetical protein
MRTAIATISQGGEKISTDSTTIDQPITQITPATVSS